MPGSTARSKLIALVDEYGRAVCEYSQRVRNVDSLKRTRDELIDAIDRLLWQVQSGEPSVINGCGLCGGWGCYMCPKT
jgi:hypothetical protein